MQEFPHHYQVGASADAEGEIGIESEGLPRIVSDAPVEFGGPGGRWSPETLLLGAVADCFILTFRAVAAASKLPWTSLHCDVEGVLDRVERSIQFTEIRTRATLRVPPGTDEERATRLLTRAEQACLIANSLKAKTHLTTNVETA